METKKQVNQISDLEKNDIANMIKDEKNTTEVVAENSEEEVLEETNLEEKQINDTEKANIIFLLRNNVLTRNISAQYNNTDFSKLTMQEIVDIFEEIVEEQDISIIKSQVTKLSTSFHILVKENKKLELEKFISTGGAADDFKYIENELEVKFNEALNKYRRNRSKHIKNLEAQKTVNLKLKYELLEELKVLIASEETLKKTYDEFKKLQEKWKEIGMIPSSELRNLWQSYHFLVEKFFDKVRINRELRDLDLKKNLEAKIEICEKAEELIVEKSITKSFKLLQFYHDKWREIGPVPTDIKDAVWERFKGITDKINARRKEHYKELQDQQEENYKTKKALCEKAKEIATEQVDTLKGWQNSTNKLNELLKLWKTIGRAPRAQNDEIWALFKGYLDTFFNAKRDYLGELKEQQVNNYNLKLNLCAKAEAIADSTEWSNTTRELISFQKEWKNIGPVPRKNSDKIWKRFRTACDKFFNNKSTHFKNLHGVEDENLKKKKELISLINDYKVVDDKNANLTSLKSFQKQWIDIGFVPFKEKEKIQNDYRAAIDQLFNKMDVNKSELSAADFKDKMALLKSGPDADIRLSKERSLISNKIRKIQEDLTVWENNIGFFSSSKQSSKLVEDFHRKIEKAKNEIASLKSRIKLIG